MTSKLMQSYEEGYKMGARTETRPPRIGKRRFNRTWKNANLNTFEALCLGEIDGLKARLESIETLAGL